MGSEGVFRSPVHRNVRITRVNDLIRVVALHASVMASGSLSYAVRPECLLDLNSRPQ